MPRFATFRSEYEYFETIHDNPLVVFRDSVLSPVECQYLINLAKGQVNRAKVSLDEESTVIPGRSGGNLWLRYKDDPNVKAIGERIAAIVGIPLSNAESMQILHYGPGQEYRGHFDAYDLTTLRGQRCCTYGGQRLVTALIYLNQVDEGGETIFPKLGIKVASKQGRLAVFHNTTEDNTKPHPGSLHAGAPIIKGEKWAFNIWFHTRPMREKQDFDQYDTLMAVPRPEPKETNEG
jgi:hypothetical protein